MAKYTEETKAEAVQAVKDGKSFKEIQSTIGPNPKAVMRYLAKASIVYADLKKELIASGKLKPAVNKNKSIKEKEAKAIKAKAAVKPTETTIEE